MTAVQGVLLKERDALAAQLEEAERIADDRKRRHAIEAKRGELELAAADAEVAILNAQDEARSEYEAATHEYRSECERVEKAAEKLIGSMNAARTHRARLDALRKRAAKSLDLELPTVPRFASSHLSDYETDRAWRAFISRWQVGTRAGFDW